LIPDTGMKPKQRLLLFLGIVSGGLGVSEAWDLISGHTAADYTGHITLLVLLLGVSVFSSVMALRRGSKPQGGK